MKIADIMTSNVITAGPQVSVSEVAKLMAEHKISGIPIVDDAGALLGIVTERELLPKMKGVPFSNVKLPALLGEWVGDGDFESAIAAAMQKKVEEIMSGNLVTIEAEDELVRAAELMAQHSIKRLPVMQAGKMVGIVTRADLVRAIAKDSTGA